MKFGRRIKVGYPIVNPEATLTAPGLTLFRMGGPIHRLWSAQEADQSQPALDRYRGS